MPMTVFDISDEPDKFIKANSPNVNRFVIMKYSHTHPELIIVAVINEEDGEAISGICPIRENHESLRRVIELLDYSGCRWLYDRGALLANDDAYT